MNGSTEAGAAPRAAIRPRSRLAELWRSLRLRDAALLTVLPVLLVLGLFADAGIRFSRAIQFDDWWGARASVRGMFGERLAALAHLPAEVALRTRLNPEAPDPAIIRLDVARRAWDSMQLDPLAMWDEWVDGSLRYGGTTIPVSLRKRGDNSIHWTTEKRTLTVRTPRDDQYKHIRRFALSVKDVIPAYLANRLAHEFDVLAPRTEIVPVFLNNQFYGLFRFSEVVDESMLRPDDRMPGNIFRGDAAERGDFYRGTPRNLFDNPYIWGRAAANDRVSSAGSGQLRDLLVDLRGGEFADHQRLVARFDRDDIARLFAYLLVVGDPYHMDRVHNEFLYEDPSTQQFSFIPWDIRIRDLSRPERTLNDVFQALLSDPWVVDAVMREVKIALDDRQVVAVADSLMRATESRNADYIAYDRGRVGLVPDIGSGAAAGATVEANAGLLRRWLAADTVAVNVAPGGAAAIVDLELRGLVGADLVGLEFAAAPGRPRLYADRNRNAVLDRDDPEIELEIAGGRATARTAVPLLPGWDTAEPGVRPGRMAYRFFLTASTAMPTPILRNRLTGAPAATVAWRAGDPIGGATGWHPWRYPVPRGRVVRLAGTVRLDSTLRTRLEDTLVIAAGTTLRLGPDVSIMARGPVRAVGTAAQPIRVVPAVEGRPWGTFALQGPGTGGSVVRNVEFREGGGAVVDRIEYIGMVNVHRSRGVVFDSVYFVENRRSDDTFHALHSTITLTNSRFDRANSDAVDLDVSDGELRGNVFESSGGDAIDLMASAPRIVANRIRNAGDKGISVGENSSPFIFDNLIEDSPVGIEVKDRSAPVILNVEVRGTGRGLRSRMKNWRYAGSGFGALFNSRLESPTPLALDTLARLVSAGAAGLDSAAAPSPAPLDWLYASQGIDPGEPTIGLPGTWRDVAPVPPLAVMRFADDFESVAAGWEAGRRIVRLEQRRGVLVIAAEGGSGLVRRAVDWEIGPQGGVVVLEVSGRDLAGARVVVVGAAEEQAAAFEPGGGLRFFSLVELPLPAGRYREIRIELQPTPGLSHIQRSTGLSLLRAGRLDVRSVAVYPRAGRP